MRRHGKTVLEITGWSSDARDYARVRIREMGTCEGVPVGFEYETGDLHIITEILKYLSNYELRKWYNKKSFLLDANEKGYDIFLGSIDSSVKRIMLIDDYLSIYPATYKVMNPDGIDWSVMQDLLKEMNSDF